MQKNNTLHYNNHLKYNGISVLLHAVAISPLLLLFLQVYNTYSTIALVATTHQTFNKMNRAMDPLQKKISVSHHRELTDKNIILPPRYRQIKNQQKKNIHK